MPQQIFQSSSELQNIPEAAPSSPSFSISEGLARRDLRPECFRDATGELAEAIKRDQANSRRVAAAVATIYQAQGELQETTLEHVFEMKSVLSAEQYRKLLALTADELNEANSGE